MLENHKQVILDRHSGAFKRATFDGKGVSCYTLRDFTFRLLVCAMQAQTEPSTCRLACDYRTAKAGAIFFQARKTQR